MAEDMIVRAGRAAKDAATKARRQRLKQLLDRTDADDETFMAALDPSREEESLAVGRAALLAALDPEDEALVRRAAESMASVMPFYEALANTRGVILALRNVAQGEQPVRSDMREKD